MKLKRLRDPISYFSEEEGMSDAGVYSYATSIAGNFIRNIFHNSSQDSSATVFELRALLHRSIENHEI